MFIRAIVTGAKLDCKREGEFLKLLAIWSAVVVVAAWASSKPTKCGEEQGGVQQAEQSDNAEKWGDQ